MNEGGLRVGSATVRVSNIKNLPTYSPTPRAVMAHALFGISALRDRPTSEEQVGLVPGRGWGR